MYSAMSESLLSNPDAALVYCVPAAGGPVRGPWFYNADGDESPGSGWPRTYITWHIWQTGVRWTRPQAEWESMSWWENFQESMLIFLDCFSRDMTFKLSVGQRRGGQECDWKLESIANEKNIDEHIEMRYIETIGTSMHIRDDLRKWNIKKYFLALTEVTSIVRGHQLYLSTPTGTLCICFLCVAHDFSWILTVFGNAILVFLPCLTTRTSVFFTVFFKIIPCPFLSMGPYGALGGLGVVPKVVLGSPTLSWLMLSLRAVDSPEADLPQLSLHWFRVNEEIAIQEIAIQGRGEETVNRCWRDCKQTP